MALGDEVVEFVGLHLLEDADQAGGVGQVAVVEDEAPVGGMRILVEMVDAVGVEQRAAALDTVDFVAFLQQEFGEIATVLAGDAGDEGFFHGSCVLDVKGGSVPDAPGTSAKVWFEWCSHSRRRVGAHGNSDAKGPRPCRRASGC